MRPTSLLLVVLSTVLAPAAAQVAVRPIEESAEKPARKPDPKIAARLAVADRVATWLDAQAEETPAGVRWAVDPTTRRKRFNPWLYHGAAGVILFYLEHFEATGRAKSLALARAGAAHAWDEVGDRLGRQQKGLYTGLAGLAFVFGEIFKTTRDAADRARMVACVDALAESAKAKGEGCTWGPVTDIISGTAGIGLAMLRIHEDHGIAKAKDLAARAGEAMLAAAEKVGPYSRWSMSATYRRRMPNFSHGTAGVAYFLARVHELTGEARFLERARAGAEYLMSITGDDGFVHHDSDDTELHYLSWCHGPPGTARLFRLLAKSSDDPRFAKWIHTARTKLAATKIPKERTPGFWNNHGQCCGTAGVIDFFLHERSSGPIDTVPDARADPETTSKAAVMEKRLDGMFAVLEAAAEKVDAGLRWTGAEHRVRPKLLSTQTGYTQGAAGIGLVFLHDAARRRGAPRRIVLPDSSHPRQTKAFRQPIR